MAASQPRRRTALRGSRIERWRADASFVGVKVGSDGGGVGERVLGPVEAEAEAGAASGICREHGDRSFL